MVSFKKTILDRQVPRRGMHMSRCKHIHSLSLTLTLTYTHCLHSLSCQGYVSILRFIFPGSCFTHPCHKWEVGAAVRICDSPKVTINKIPLKGAQRQVLRTHVWDLSTLLQDTPNKGARVFSFMSGWCLWFQGADRDY